MSVESTGMATKPFTAVSKYDERIEELLAKQAEASKEFNEIFTSKEYGLIEDSRKLMKNLDVAVRSMLPLLHTSLRAHSLHADCTK